MNEPLKPPEIPPPAIPGRTFWRWLFWLTLIHTVFFGVLDFVIISQWLGPQYMSMASYQPGQFLAFAVLLVFQFIPALLGILVVFNAFALCLIAWLIRGHPSRKLMKVYSIGSTPVPVILATAFLILQLHGGQLTSGNTTLGQNPSEFCSGLAATLLLAAPTILILIGRLRHMPPQSLPGYCRHCNYNLTANTTGICPECGTPTNRPPVQK